MLPKEISNPRNWGCTSHSWSLFSGMQQQQQQRTIKCLQELWTGTPGGCLITNGWYRFEFQEHLCCLAPKCFLCLFVCLLISLLFVPECFICLFVSFVVCPRIFLPAARLRVSSWLKCAPVFTAKCVALQFAQSARTLDNKSISILNFRSTDNLPVGLGMHWSTNNLLNKSHCFQDRKARWHFFGFSWTHRPFGCTLVLLRGPQTALPM